MSQLPPEGRHRARRLAFSSGAAAASLGVASSVAASTDTSLAGPLGLAAALAGVYAWAANEFGNDPADPNYDRAAVVRRIPLQVSHFPPGALQADLARLAVTLAEATGWVRAMLRSFERAQGAAQAHEDRLANERLVETRELARGTAHRAGHATRRLESTARTIDRHAADLPWAHDLAPLRPLSAQALGYEVLGFIYLAGLPLRDFERASEASSHREDTSASASVSQACMISAEASRAFAQFLRNWQPDLRELFGTIR